MDHFQIRIIAALTLAVSHGTNMQAASFRSCLLRECKFQCFQNVGKSTIKKRSTYTACPENSHHLNLTKQMIYYSWQGLATLYEQKNQFS